MSNIPRSLKKNGLTHKHIISLVGEGLNAGQIAKASGYGRTGIQRTIQRLRAKGEL